MLARRLADRKIGLDLSPAAKRLVAKEGFDPVYGARPIRRAIQRLVLDPLAQKVLSGEFAEGDTVFVDVRDGQVTFLKQEYAKEEPEKRQPAGAKRPN